MKLIQILLPAIIEDSSTFSQDDYIKVRIELTKLFGGITVYARSPAAGFWKESEFKTVKDDIVIYEVQTVEFNREWWVVYKKKLEEMFQQEEILIRHWEIDIVK